MSAIPLFPLQTVLYPDGYLPLQIFEVRYLDMVKRCIEHKEDFGVVALVQGDEVRKPDQHETLCAVGTMAHIEEWKAILPGLMQVRCSGQQRFRIVSAEQLKHGLWMADVSPIDGDMTVPVPSDQQDVADSLGILIQTLQERGIPAGQMPMQAPYRLQEAGWVANRWCELLRLTLAQKQLLLAQENPVLRLELVQDVMVEHGLLN
ncbi:MULTISPECIES: LON peptidase substrate-binding domain-containing protein [unclassified Duganella]|uniref:LON peptidase substrate-binding domain-containing protein n=1 Tax=unclassified Duganella TaxID=2636909 RepID=UPI0006FAE74B|nr:MULTISPECIES: LON peptidase substrate-binding domain-containing protein [unclassified Duganella]KQV59503.1 peptidase S16 [Duganella sp. Root336D2]KRB93903.1 peptidase S16 [Duganella sp. Root198D2]